MKFSPAFFVLFLAFPVLASAQLLNRAPQVLDEIAEPVDWQDGDVLKYAVSETRESALSIPLKNDHLVAERFRFWLKGDNSGNKLTFWFHHKPTDQWIAVPNIAIDFEGWRHFEIPAQSPFHRFHRSIDEFKLVVNAAEGAATSAGELELRRLELVTYKPFDAPLTKKDIPSPLFDTVGSPTAQQMKVGADIGVNLHMSIVNWLDNGDPKQRVDYAARSLPWIQDAKMMRGICLYGNPSEQWVQQNPEMMPKGGDGQYYAGGGAFTSPWNPDARDLWEDHIQDSLRQLRREGVLRLVELVEICPGEEGEVSFNWDQVWAFDEYAVREYRDYLKRLYQNKIELLNRDWNSQYRSFKVIHPPAEYYPDRENWVFCDFYRLSFLRYCIFLADAVLKVHEPDYWLWMTHSNPGYPLRHNSARYPIFYAENMRRLGILDYAQVAASWQHPEDVQLMQSMGIRVVGEIDVLPTVERLQEVFADSTKMGMDGVFVGVLEPHSENGKLTPLGEECQRLIRSFRENGTAQ